MDGQHAAPRRGFTLVEVLLAGLIVSLVLGSVSLSMSNIGKAKSLGKERLDMHLRADAALTTLRREVISVMRSDDLFDTRFLLYDEAVTTPFGDMDRDELLVFNTRLRPIRTLDQFSGEGVEYETQFRVEDDEHGPALWQRRDRMPDEYPMGGGRATPLVDGIIGLMIEAYDGEQWWSEWDSDEQGLPHAVRIIVTASGHRDHDDLYDAPLAVLRTVVPIDRVVIPRDHFEVEEEEGEEGLEEGETAGEGGELPGDAEGLIEQAGGIPGGGSIGGSQGGRGGGNGRGGGASGSTPAPPPPAGGGTRAPRSGSLIPSGSRNN